MVPISEKGMLNRTAIALVFNAVYELAKNPDFDHKTKIGWRLA